MRFGIAAWAIALALGGTQALAQESPPPAANTAEPTTVGPRELEGFSLNGTVTRPAPAPTRPTPAPATGTRPTPAPTAPVTTPGANPPRAATTAVERPPPEPPSTVLVRPRSDPSDSVTVALPPPREPAAGAARPRTRPAAQPGFKLPGAPAAEEGASPLPWIVALLLLAAGGVLFLWRQRARAAAAGVGGSSHAFAGTAPPGTRPPAKAPVAPRAAPPRAAPPRAAPPDAVPPAAARPTSAPLGVVSTRLRPWVEIQFVPLRCVVEQDNAAVQFEVTLYNSGGAPAREVLIEGAMFNAGADQDEQIGGFFARPLAKGDRIPIIQPLQKFAMQSAVGLSLDQLRVFEAKGRRFFVPLLGFNALYRWSGGEGQTSASFLVGRDSQDAEKMAPFRLDLGPRVFRGLGAREHHLRVRN